jgi:hypothetical protein
VVSVSVLHELDPSNGDFVLCAFMLCL